MLTSCLINQKKNNLVLVEDFPLIIPTKFYEIYSVATEAWTLLMIEGNAKHKMKTKAHIDFQSRCANKTNKDVLMFLVLIN